MILNIRRLFGYLLLSFAVLTGGLTWWQLLDAQRLDARADNPQVIAAHRSAPRGTIFDSQGRVLASSAVVDGISRRTYADAAFTHLIGYASLRYGTTGLEQAYDSILTGQADPNPLRQVVNDILARPPVSRDLTLTVDQRLEDYAATLLAGKVGAVFALDPRTGAVLASVSTPTFDATPISGDPAAAGGPMAAIQANPDHPLIDRARQGIYTPGSVMKVLTASAALDSGAITPRTTFPDQPKEEVSGFTVDGFTITEHDLGSLKPALWALSPAMQVSSNIFFAHVGLKLGGSPFLEYARRFGFCAPLEIGSGSHALQVSPSYLTAPALNGGCSPFSDNVELASAAFGQAQVTVTPVEMALVAATIANGGVMPEPYVVQDIRSHAADPASGPSPQILESSTPAAGRRVVSSTTAAEVRSAMLDAVQGPIGRYYAGAGAVRLYGISGVETAGKTGTAQRAAGPPHSWFIGFAPAQTAATPSIAIAVIVEGGGAGSGEAAPIGGKVMAEWLKLAAAAAG